MVGGPLVPTCEMNGSARERIATKPRRTYFVRKGMRTAWAIRATTTGGTATSATEADGRGRRTAVPVLCRLHRAAPSNATQGLERRWVARGADELTHGIWRRMSVMLRVYCCDIGSVKVNRKTKDTSFGWVRAYEVDGDVRVEGNANIDDCRRHLGEDVRAGNVVTLGLEAPLFLPMANVLTDLSCGREGEADRSCFAPAGGYVATLGLHEAVYLFQALKSAGAKALLRWSTWNEIDPSMVLIWEAFVSGVAHTKSRSHCHDAASAALAFLRGRPNLKTDVRVDAPRETFSLAGAALLWAKLSTDLALLREPVLVVKPASGYEGPIEHPRPVVAPGGAAAVSSPADE
jgi:hypothetical protein